MLNQEVSLLNAAGDTCPMSCPAGQVAQLDAQGVCVCVPKIAPSIDTWKIVLGFGGAAALGVGGYIAWRRSRRRRRRR